jgi:hypothetical protein
MADYEGGGSLLQFNLGVVRSVDTINKKAVVTMRPGMQDRVINLDYPLSRQYVPVPGQIVLVLLLGDQKSDDMSRSSSMSYDARIVCEFGDETLNVQKSRPLQTGEIMIQGQGGGFLYADQNGNAMMSDQAMSNVVQLLANTAISLVGDALSIQIKGVGKLNITPKSDSNPDAKLELIKTDTQGAMKSRVVVQDDKVIMEGAIVEVGTKQIPYTQCGVVTSRSGVPGNHSFCLITGAPIPGSAQVTAANTPT